MLIFANSRRSGKTTDAIILAASTKSILVTPTQETARIAERQAHEMGYPIIAIGAKQYFDKPMLGFMKGGSQRPRVVIDELDWVLREAFGCDVIMATMTGATLTGEGGRDDG